MPESPVDPHYSQELRDKAESLLQKGNAMACRGHFLSVEALSVLFKLASSPDSAADSLKMLHEFQTHQIELDLQLEQMEVNERETSAELARYQAFFEYAPVGYFIINRAGLITECNQAGAELFERDRAELDGQALENCLKPDSRPVINWRLGKLFKGSRSESCTVQTADGNPGRTLRVIAKLAPTDDMVFMTISEQERQVPI